MATATGGATWRSLRLNGNLRAGRLALPPGVRNGRTEVERATRACMCLRRSRLGRCPDWSDRTPVPPRRQRVSHGQVKGDEKLPLRRFGARRVACALHVRTLVRWRTRRPRVPRVQQRCRRIGWLRRTRSSPGTLHLELAAATLQQFVVAQFLRRTVSGRRLRFRMNRAPPGADGLGFQLSAFGHGYESSFGG
jgi:hypothetical protein